MLEHLRELFRYRDLLLTLAQRDIKVRYRQTFLGVAWAILQPLSYMIIFTLVFSRFGNVSSEGVPYPLFSYTGLVPWTFFTAGLGVAVSSVTGNMNLVKKIYFPREVFPIGVVLACLVDFLVASTLVGGLMVIYGFRPSLDFLWLPWLVAVEIGFLLALSLVVSALNVFYRDTKYIVPLMLQLGLFVTPVIYPIQAVPEHLRRWYFFNPIAVVIDGIRGVVLHHRAPDLQVLSLTSLFVGAMLIGAYMIFTKAEERFADAI